jgi:tetratricopeptide (TPR) repeat protein
MKRMIILVLLMCATARSAEDKPVTINWSATDVSGAKLTVPANDRTCVVAFVRGEQEQSKSALARIRASTRDASDVNVIVVVNGERADQHAKTFATSADCAGWSIVVDPDFASSGKLNVHVWPTTVIVDRACTRIAHLAGLSNAFETDLPAYLERAANKIDQATLTARLASREVVGESSKTVANVHLRTAQQLIDSGQPEQARTQIEEGLKANPNDAALQLALVRVQLQLKKPAEALKLLDQLKPDAAPAWQTAALRGRALLALEKWNEAKSVLDDALKLNPDPTEVHYLLGVIYAHESDWPRAAESFRKAFESTDAGKRVVVK